MCTERLLTDMEVRTKVMAVASLADHPSLAVTPSLAELAQEVLTQVVSQEVRTQVEAHVLVVSLEVRTQVEVHMVVDHMVVAEVTSEATDKKGYSSSVRTSAFDIL